MVQWSDMTVSPQSRWVKIKKTPLFTSSYTLEKEFILKNYLLSVKNYQVVNQHASRIRQETSYPGCPMVRLAIPE